MAEQKTNDVARIVSVGSSLDLNFTLSLTEHQCTTFGIEYDKITSLHDLKDALKLNENQGHSTIHSLISLSSSNFLLNSLLYLNRANKSKSFIEYIVPFTVKYTDDDLFIKDVIKHVTEINLLFILEENLLNINPNITFTFKLLSDNDDDILSTKNFIVSNKNMWEDSNGYSGDLYTGFSFVNECNVFYTTIMDILQCKLNSYDEIQSFFSLLIQENPEVMICINYSGYFDNTTKIEIELMHAIEEIMGITDIFVFEKKEIADFFLLSKTLNESKPRKSKRQNETINVDQVFLREITKKKKEQKMKIGIIVDELKTTTVIQQDPNSGLVLFHSLFNLNFIPESITKNDTMEYDKLIFEQYNILKSVYTGGFLSRLFNKKSFQTCFTAGNESVKRIIDIIRFNLDYPTDVTFYEILVKKPKKVDKKELMLKKKEQQFVLDCTNVLNCKKRDYNPLYDKMCQSFFNCNTNRYHLYKKGFINKKGNILEDPNNKIFTLTKDKFLMHNYEHEKKHLLNLKENNELLKLQIKGMNTGMNSTKKSASIDDLAYFSQIKNFDKTSTRKLPSITKSKPIARMTKYSSDLYYKEIKNSKFHQKGENDKSCDGKGKTAYIDKEQFNGLLDDIEKRMTNKK